MECRDRKWVVIVLVHTKCVDKKVCLIRSYNKIITNQHAQSSGFVNLILYCHFVKGLQDYIHRVGRTARAGRSGIAISLINQYEMGWYLQIEQLIGKKHI